MPGGRRPFHAVDVHPWYDAGQRLQPPTCLGDDERQVFIDLISSTPAGQFQENDLALICRWCEASVMAARAAEELRVGGMMVAAPGGPKVNPWFAVWREAAKVQKDLALRLKLSPQARHHKAPKSLPAPLTAYERLALEGDDDGEEEVERH
jgi:phage terminase small subunit